jgi:hypothetical protein
MPCPTPASYPSTRPMTVLAPAMDWMSISRPATIAASHIISLRLESKGAPIAQGPSHARARE